MSLHPGLVECNHSLQGGEVITEQLKCLLDDGTQVQSTASHLSISSVGFTADVMRTTAQIVCLPPVLKLLFFKIETYFARKQERKTALFLKIGLERLANGFVGARLVNCDDASDR